MFSMSSALSLRELEKFMVHLEPGVRASVHAIAEEIEGDARQRCPVDTRFLHNSIGRITDQDNTYGQAGDARETFPEPPLPADGIAAVVAVGATYGAYVNDGTHKMGAQPFWTPAVESARQRFLPTLESAV